MTEDQLVDAIISVLNGPRGYEVATLVVARAREVEHVRPTDVDLEPIVKAACAFTRIPRKTLLDSRVRARSVTRTRHMIAYLARQTLKASYAEIGRRMSQDHTTIQAGVRRAAEKLDAGDPSTVLLRAAILRRMDGPTEG